MENTIWASITGAYNKIEKRYRVCFFAALIFGLMAHIFALTNHLYNYDELWHTPTGFGTGIEVGRWALSITVYIQKLLFIETFTIPAVNGFVTIVLYAIVACFVVSVYDIEDEFFAAMVGGMMITFPALVCRMFFMFTTHYYAIGIAMVSAGVWVLVKKKHSILNVIVAVAFLVYGMAIYQANFVTGVCMIVGYLLQKFIREDFELKEVFRNCVNYVIYLGVCMVLFLVGSKVILTITGKEMQTYENLDTMGQLSISQLIKGIVKCYKLFVRMPLRDAYAMNPNGIARFTFGFSMLVLMYTFIRVWMMKKPIHMKIFVTLIMVALPLAVNLIQIMAISSGTMYSIMVYEMVFILLIPVACVEALKGVDTSMNSLSESVVVKARPYVGIATAIVLLLGIVNYIWFANGNYLEMDYTNARDYAYYTVLASQIKSVDGYRDDMPIHKVGVPVNDSTYPSMNIVDYTFNLTGKAYTNISAYSSWNIMTRVVGFDPVERNSNEDEEYFRSLPEVQSMSNYPDSGSIKIIDDTVVIKFQDVEELQ